MHTTRRAATAALIATTLSPLATTTAATRPLRLLVPYPPGGIVDLVARHLATPLRQSLQQDVVVENLAGAAGALAFQRLLAGPRDGSELALGTDSDAILVPLVNPEARYKPADLRSLGVISSSPMVLVAGARQTAADAAALVSTLRTGGAPLRLGSYGVGSNSHLCAEDFAERLALAIVHVPYKGIAPLLQDLMGAHVDAAFLPLAGGIADMLVAGKLRPLALAAAQPHARLPALPTLAQLLPLPGFVHSSWSALMLPADTPDAAVQRLHRALSDCLREPGFRQAMESSGSAVTPPASLAEAARVFDEQAERYRVLLAQLRARGVDLGR